MMKFKSLSMPAPSVGQSYTGIPKQVVPDQSMSLQEILERFTRGEPLEVGRDGSFDDQGDDDLEKVSKMDLVDKAEFVDRLKQTQKDYTKQEKKKAEAEKARLEKMAVEKLAADKMAADEAAKNAK